MVLMAMGDNKGLNFVLIFVQIGKVRDDNRFKIGSAGRLVGVKDFSLLIEIANMVHVKEKNIEFYIAGEGPEYNKLSSLISKYHLNNVVFLEGHIQNMLPFYKKLDVYINTSIHEGIPMTVLEAMDHGLPVIAPHVGGIPEIINNGSEGFLIDNRSPKSFVNSCIKLYEDKKLYEKCSIAAATRVKNSFSVNSMESNYFNLYRNIIESKI